MTRRHTRFVALAFVASGACEGCASDRVTSSSGIVRSASSARSSESIAVALAKLSEVRNTFEATHHSVAPNTSVYAPLDARSDLVASSFTVTVNGAREAHGTLNPRRVSAGTSSDSRISPQNSADVAPSAPAEMRRNIRVTTRQCPFNIACLSSTNERPATDGRPGVYIEYFGQAGDATPFYVTTTRYTCSQATVFTAEGRWQLQCGLTTFAYPPRNGIPVVRTCSAAVCDAPVRDDELCFALSGGCVWPSSVSVAYSVSFIPYASADISITGPSTLSAPGEYTWVANVLLSSGVVSPQQWQVRWERSTNGVDWTPISEWQPIFTTSANLGSQFPSYMIRASFASGALAVTSLAFLVTNTIELPDPAVQVSGPTEVASGALNLFEAFVPGYAGGTIQWEVVSTDGAIVAQATSAAGEQVPFRLYGADGQSLVIRTMVYKGAEPFAFGERVVSISSSGCSIVSC